MEARTPVSAVNSEWYVLATIYGEQDKDEFDEELHVRNRRVWNSWAFSQLSSIDKERLLEIQKANELELLELEELDFWSYEQAQRVREVLRERSNNGGTIPDAASLCDLKMRNFTNNVCFDGFIFPAGADFRESYFLRKASFEQAVFLGDVAFYNVEFSSISYFKRAQFKLGADFEKARFRKLSSFEDAVFDFNAWFSSAIFYEDVSFKNIEFNGEACFGAATFSAEASWSFSKFKDGVDYSYSVFQSYVNFTRVEFNGFSCFRYTQFLHTTTFRESCFFNSIPELGETLIHPGTTFTAKKELWPKIFGNDIEELRISQESLAIIRQTIALQGRPEEAHFFFRREMECRSLIGTLFERMPYALFGIFSEFGYSIKKPLVGLLVIWLFYGVAYGFMVYDAFDTWSLSSISKMASGLGLSIANMMVFLGFHGRFGVGVFEAPSPWLIFFSGFQTVVGFVFLFFLGLGLRTRFRIR